ncbi:NAD(P)H-dependent oxidoreductase [bacterium]|nr:NAD(P)H-dependent oxidoreductase [bacterium]
MGKTRILAVNGSMREACHTIELARIAMAAAEEAGAEVQLLDLREVGLPMYEAHLDYEDQPAVQRVVETARWADGFLVGSPEYHGSMSGALKNWFDHLYHELAGKLFGFFAATGGSQGVSAVEHMRASAHYCHGWVLPYLAAAREADFDHHDHLTNAKVIDRLRRLGRDVAVYAPLLRRQFLADVDVAGSFAQWHRGKV